MLSAPPPSHCPPSGENSADGDAADRAARQQVHTLYAEHHGWLEGWLRRKLDNRSDAADLAQDVYLRVLLTRRLPEVGQSRAYLMTIAKGLVVDFHRRRHIERAYREALACAPELHAPDPQTRLLIIETLCEIDAALDTLAPRARQALLMSQLEGLTYRQIAERLGVSVSSVQKYMLDAVQACYAAAYE